MPKDLRVQVVDDEIIVTRPGSFYSVTYYARSIPAADRQANVGPGRFARSYEAFRVPRSGVEACQRHGAGVGLDSVEGQIEGAPAGEKVGAPVISQTARAVTVAGG